MNIQKRAHTIMRRQLGFVVACAVTLAIAACGRQVTPNPPGVGAGGAPVGFMSLTFDVAGTLNFSQYQYMIVFNTSGNGICPGTNTLQSNWGGWNFAIVAGGSQLGTSANAIYFIHSTTDPHIPPTFQPLNPPVTLLQYNPNSDGSGAEFTVVFSRNVFSGFHTGPTPAPSPSSSPLPFASTWLFNAFTTEGTGGNLQFVDSLGAGGPSGAGPQWPCSQYPLHINSSFDNPYTPLSTGLQMDPNAQITNLTIGNNP